MDYPFDPELAGVVADIPDIGSLGDLEGTRSRVKTILDELVGDVDATGVTVHDRSVPGPEGAAEVRIRVYTPDVIAAPGLLFDVHGGGFVIGDLDSDHVEMLGLAQELGVVIVSVDYRLAPENPFPAGLEDCYAALVWAVEHADELGVDRDRVVVRGASAGGGLCAALALLTRDRGGPAITFQFLAVPEVDDRLETGSMRRFDDTPLWRLPNARYSWDYYLGGEGIRGTEGVSPYAAPIRASDLMGLPPAYISVMEFDPLRDEGIAYAQALLAAHVPTELHLFPGTFHGSLLVDSVVSRREIAESRAVLGRALGVEGK